MRLGLPASVAAVAVNGARDASRAIEVTPVVRAYTPRFRLRRAVPSPMCNRIGASLPHSHLIFIRAGTFNTAAITGTRGSITVATGLRGGNSGSARPLDIN
ncbi:hypothetical protein GCM10017687_16320 [Streptomyces echinatus]